MAPADLQAVRRTVVQGSFLLRYRSLVLVVCFVGIVWAFAPWSLPLVTMRKTIVVLLIWGGLLFASTMFQRRLIPRRKPQQLAAALVNHGFCGCCAYDLRATEPDPVDGCRVCVECKAAWRIER